MCLQNNIDKVIEDCTTALKLNTYYSKAMLRRAKAAEKQNDLDLALEDLATACILERFQSSDNVAELDRVAKAAGTCQIISNCYLNFKFQHFFTIFSQQRCRRVY